MSATLSESQVVVEINGTVYSSRRHKGLLSHVDVELTTDRSGEANIAMMDPDFRVTDFHLDATGMKRAEVRVWMGFGASLEQGPALFEGLLSRHSHDGLMATFTFDDHTSKMKQKKRPRYHNRTTGLGLLRKLAKENGLGFVVDKDVPDSEEWDVIIQWEQSDWKLAMETARRLGLRLYVRGQTLYVQEAGKVGDAVADIVYRERDSDFQLLRGCGLSHKLPENKRGRHGRVEVIARGRSGRRLSGVDGDDDGRGTRVVESNEDMPASTERAARRRARARRSNQREDAFEHRIRLLPVFLRRHQPLLQGQSVRVLQMGKFYSGAYIIRTASYSFEPGRFSCELTLRRDIRGKRRSGRRSR